MSMEKILNMKTIHIIMFIYLNCDILKIEYLSPGLLWSHNI